MCTTALNGTPTYVPARDYFGQAKRLNSNLKSLKSVSREYRRMRVRELKGVAAQKERQERDRYRLSENHSQGAAAREWR